MILTADPSSSYRAYASEIDQAIQSVLASGWYILGDNVAEFEREFAGWCGSAFGIGVASGTDSICLALRALGAGPGKEVITVSHTAVATVAAIEAVGATPVLADVDADTYTMDAESAKALVSEQTCAIMPVHLYGHPADMKALGELSRINGIALVEDCAQAHGAMLDGNRVGSFGDVGCFSLYPTKNLGAIGDGGIVVSAAPELAEALKLIRQYGWDTPQHSIRPGVCSRLDEIQAAILRVKLKHLDDEIRRRQEIAGIYDAAFAKLDIKCPLVRENAEHAYHLYVVQLAARDAVKVALAERGVVAGIHYPIPVHAQPTYIGRVRSASMTVTEQIQSRILSLPLYPQMSETDVDTVIDAVRTCVN